MYSTDVLLVEGKDDLHVCSHFMQRHAFPKSVTVRDQNGIDGILQALPQFLKSNVVRNLGVVVDADNDVLARWEQLHNLLLEAGCHSISKTPNRDGFISVSRRGIKVGVWMMPDNSATGEIENFVSLLVPDGDALWPHAHQSVDNIAPADRRFKDNDFVRSVIHTWLAWQEDPGTPMGLAIAKRYLDASSPGARSFLTWLKRLFLETSAQVEAAASSDL